MSIVNLVSGTKDLTVLGIKGFNKDLSCRGYQFSNCSGVFHLNEIRLKLKQLYVKTTN